MHHLGKSMLAAFVLVIGSGEARADDYALVHAIDNDETIIKKGLSEFECRALKAKLVADGTIKVEGDVEDPNLGVLACLRESDL